MRIRTLLAAILATGAALLIGPATAQATTAAGRTGTAASEYGQHVRECAQTMGYSGEHNPGMHQGAAGWDGMPCM